MELYSKLEKMKEMKKLFCFLIFISGIQGVLSQKMNNSESIQEIFDKGQYYLDMVDVVLVEPSKDLQKFKDFFYIDNDSKIRPIGNPNNLATYLHTHFQHDDGEFVLQIINKNSYLATVENSLLNLNPINNNELLSFAIDLERNILEVGDSKIPLRKKGKKVKTRNNIFNSELEGVEWQMDSEFQADNYQDVPFDDFNLKVLKIKGSNKIYIEMMAISPFAGENKSKIKYKLLTTDSHLK